MADPIILANDICEVTYSGTLCGQKVLTVMHYRAKTVVLNDMASALDEFNTSLQAPTKQVKQYLAAAASNYQMDELVLQMISPVRFARFPYTVDSPGLETDEAVTADLAAVFEFSTLFAAQRKLKLNRGFTGGVHYAPIPTTFVADGLIDAGYRGGALDDLASLLHDEVVTAGGNHWWPVIYHRNDDTVKYTDISRYFVKAEARVMRRRTVGRGI